MPSQATRTAKITKIDAKESLSVAVWERKAREDRASQRIDADEEFGNVDI